MLFFFFSSRRRHTRSLRDWSSDVCSSDLETRDERYRNRRAPGRIELDSTWRAAIAIAFIAGFVRESFVLVLPFAFFRTRSEERRVGKECRSRWSPDGEEEKRAGGMCLVVC